MNSYVEESVIRRLRSAGGIEVRPGGRGADLVLSVKGAETSILLEVKHHFTDRVLDELDELEDRHPQERARTVLVVPRLSTRRRDDLLRRGISWIEYKTGTVHLRVPGLAIDLPEQSVSKSKAEVPMPSLAGKAGTIVEALIELGLERDLLSQPEVADLTGSTQAWTSRVFSALVAADALEVVGKGPSKQWRPNVEDLLTLWTAAGGPSPTVTGVYAWGRSQRDLYKSILTASGRGQTRYAIGGVAAANLHEPSLTALPLVAVWMPNSTPPRDVVTKLDGEIVDSGANILLWQAKGDPALCLAGPLARWRSDAAEEVKQLSVVTPARAVLESLDSAGRGPELAENLRRRILQSVPPHDV